MTRRRRLPTGATGWLPFLLGGLVTLLSATGRTEDLRVSSERVSGPRGYLSWSVYLASPMNDAWSVWAGYLSLVEISGAPNTPSVMFGGRYRDAEQETAGGIALIFRQGPDSFSSATLALDGGQALNRLAPSLGLDTWVELQAGFTSSSSVTTSTTVLTAGSGRHRRFGTRSTSSALFQTSVGLLLRHPLSPADAIQGSASGFFYNASVDALTQLPSVSLPGSSVAVPTLPASQFSFGTSHTLFDRWELSWDVTRTHDYYEPVPIDAYGIRAAWILTDALTARGSWMRVTHGAGLGEYVGFGGTLQF